uniref:non-specific serine/threonine protein kinase n=1 Tax=Astyanax mexicanus TaxID=7994 RepID=A0A8B9JNB5_ASTMX
MVENTQKAMEPCSDSTGRGKGKRKRVEEPSSCPAHLGTGKVPVTDAPPRKKRMKVTTSGCTNAIKPNTFDSLYSTGVKLGQGSFGAVFEGTRLCDGLQVAIKFVTKQDSDCYVQSADDDSKTVPIEVALMLRMSNPPVDNIVKLIEWFDEPECFILILERPQPCIDLETFLDSNGGSLTKTMFKDIMLQAVRAARKCYQRGVLHRDIKPKNFVINTDTMELKLIDFGCGDWVRRDGYANFAGTFKYCPPEYLLSKRYHARSATVWSLGVLLFRMICGYHPFTTAKDILEGISYLENSQSDECWDLIHWCLQCEPTMRPSFQQILLHDWFESA